MNLKRTRFSYMLPSRESLRSKDTQRLKVKTDKNISHANGNKRKAGIVILMSKKIDFKRNTAINDKKAII